jgi:hypothetical protein
LRGNDAEGREAKARQGGNEDDKQAHNSLVLTLLIVTKRRLNRSASQRRTAKTVQKLKDVVSTVRRNLQKS